MSKHTFTSYEEQWSTLRDKKPSDALELWTVPAYRATSEDRDGDYEEDQSFCAGQAYGDTDQVREGDGPTPPGGDVEGPRPGEEEYWAAALYPFITGRQSSSDAVWVKLPRAFMEAYTEIDGRVSSIATQFYKQNEWNDHIQHSMETMSERADELITLRETVAMLETRVNEISQARDGLIECKPAGRPKRSQ